MSRLDALPADQRSVLQLLLRQGKGYDDLSGLLRLDTGQVRSRAYDALDALGPGAAGLSAERRQEIADWLLGQQSPDQATATRAFVGESPAGRAWADAVASELQPLAGERLPELPVDGTAPAGSAAENGGGPFSLAPNPSALAPSTLPRVSRRGGALLIGGVVAAVVAVVLVLVLTGGKDDKSGGTASASTSTTSTQPQVKAQINLVPPTGAPAAKALAIVQIVDLNGQQAINAVAQGLPTTTKAAYAIWAYTSPSVSRLIGGFDKKDDKGHLVYQGALPQDVTDISRYREILVTRETNGSPKKPGTIYLRGPMQSAPGG
jgi:hypothetical protein